MMKSKLWTKWISPSAISVFSLLPMTIITSCATTTNEEPKTDGGVGIVPEERPDIKDLWNPAPSENLNGLKIDKYANVIKQMQLSASDQMSQYDNQKLTNRLWNGTNLDKSYRIEIISGNTSSGTLSLKLIRPGVPDTTINISNFDTNAPMYHQYQSFEIKLDAWFDKLLPINTSSNFATEIEKIDSNNWSEIIKDGFVTIYDKATLKPLKTAKLSELKAAGYQFQFKARINKSEIRLDITTFMYGYIYQNQTWVANPDSLEEITQMGMLLIHLPTINDAKKYLLSKTTFDANIASHTLPSAIIGQIIAWSQHDFGAFYDDDLVVNPLVNDGSAFQQRYFKNQPLRLNFNKYIYSGDDTKGILTVNIGLLIAGEDSGFEQSLTIDKMQTNQNLVQHINTTVDNWNIDGGWKTSLIANLKREASLKQKIDQYFQNPSGSWTDLSINGNDMIHPQLKQVIFANGQNRQDLWNWFVNQFGQTKAITLFGKAVNPDFDNASPLAKPNNGQYLFYNNLININENIVGLDYLSLDFTNLTTKLVKTANNTLQLKFENIKTVLNTFTSDDIRGNLVISLDINQADWNKQ